MTFAETLLQKLVSWRPQDGRQTLDVQDPASGWKAALSADCIDQVGCRLWELTLTTTRAGLAGQPLKDRAEQIAGRVTGLLEPLRLLEMDDGAQQALLRSQAPAQRGEDLFYYEVRIQEGASCSVRRFQAGHQGGRRQQVAYSLTYEALLKLVSDLTAD